MNAWIIITIVGIVIAIVLSVLKVLYVVLGRRFDKDWEKMSQEERWKLQNEARKKNV